jgi:hypothetical protein
MTESTEEYDVYEVALGHLYLFKKSMTSGEFKGATAGSSRMKYKTEAGPRFVLAKRKYRGG